MSDSPFDARRVRRIDNFARHCWGTTGASLGVGLTALAGWPAALGWLIAWGGGGFVFYGLATGRIVLRRGEAE